MAYKNQLVNNPTTGQSFLFLQTAADTNGKLLEMESVFGPHSIMPPAHYHPQQVEDFTVLEGILTVNIKGQIIELKKGDNLHIPVNTVHAMWNRSDKKTTVNWKIQPALNSAHLFEAAAGLALQGKANAKGMPPFLQSVLLAKKFSNEFRLAVPVYTVQKLVFGLLAPIAKWLGYESSFTKYIKDGN